MTSKIIYPDCVRGYVFVNVKTGQNPDLVARNILNLNNNFGTELNIIIRADTMRDLPPDYHSPFDIVVAVNAANDAMFNQIMAGLTKMTEEVSGATTAIVNNYHNHSEEPSRPHVTSGYVSSTEFGNGNPLDRAGPQDHNVWG